VTPCDSRRSAHTTQRRFLIPPVSAKLTFTAVSLH